jgi:hypothetical protein
VESTIEGENIMRMARLEVDEPPAMAPCVNITCRITEDSPLWGKTYWDLEREGAAVYAAIAATDNQHFQEVFVRKFYVVPVRFVRDSFSSVLRRKLWNKVCAVPEPLELSEHRCEAIT